MSTGTIAQTLGVSTHTRLETTAADAAPVIDLDCWFNGNEHTRARLAAQVDEALCRIGFFVIVHHQVPPAIIAGASAAARAYFDRSMEDKLADRNTVNLLPRGYVPLGMSTLGRTAGQKTPDDLKEGFGMGPPDVVGTSSDPRFYLQNIWPPGSSSLRKNLETYYRSMESLACTLRQLFARALQLDADFFEPSFAGHNSHLRVINYPAQATPPAPGQLRAGAHTDYGAFTMLLAENASGGLQVRTRTGQWLDITAPSDSFVINIGDLMMMWTNDRWLSNVHRVANPDASLASVERRQSMAYFVNPREDTRVECIPTCVHAGEYPKHPPVLAGEHRLLKIRAASGH